MKKKEATLKTIGEFGLIERIIKKLGPMEKILHGGIGDDVAIIKTDGKKWLLATCDCQLENKHFKRAWLDAKTLGQKAALVNISDIASVGGFPQYALISLGLPPSTKLTFVDQLYDGLTKEFSSAGAVIVGGNIVASSKIFVDVFLIGQVKAGQAILRSGARVGDYLLVSGTLGNARAGLEILQRNLASQGNDAASPREHLGGGVAPQSNVAGTFDVPPAAHLRGGGIGEAAFKKLITKVLIQRFLLPPSRLKFAQLLAQRKLASSMIDLSDGLSSDLTRICEASKVGVELWSPKIPLSKELKKYLRNKAHHPKANLLARCPKYEVPRGSSDGGERRLNEIPRMVEQALNYALTGGEDYELLFTAPEKNLTKIKSLAKKTKTKVTPIGKIMPLNFGLKIMDKNGQKRLLQPQGWDHFKPPCQKTFSLIK